MTYSEAETFLILKYGSIQKAHSAWIVDHKCEHWGIFSEVEIERFHDFETAMHRESGLGINDPR